MELLAANTQYEDAAIMQVPQQQYMNHDDRILYHALSRAVAAQSTVAYRPTEPAAVSCQDILSYVAKNGTDPASAGRK